MTYFPSLQIRAKAELELRKRRRERPLAAHGQQYLFYGNNLTFQTMTDQQEVILVGPADAGKTLAALYFLNHCAWAYPGAQIAIVRKEYSSMPGSVLQTYQKKIIKSEDGIDIYGGEFRPERFIYPNESVIWVGGLDKASKVLSSERDLIYVNQCEELIQPEWEILLTRCSGRAGNMPFSMLLGDCNPAAPTHWIKTRERAGSVKLLDVTHKDNPTIFDPDTGKITISGEKRLAALKRLTGANLKRLFYGLWAQPEGAIYDIFDEERHKIKARSIPHTFPRVVGVDPFGAYIAALWIAYDPENQVLIVYREYYEPFGLTTPEHAKNILALSGYNQDGTIQRANAEPIFAWIGGGPSERQARLDWAAAGIPLLENTIIEVWSQIDKVIQLMRDGRLYITEDCPNLLSEIGSYKRRMVNGVITEQIEKDEEYHLHSCLRYVCAWLSTPSDQGEIVYDPVRIGRYPERLR